MGDTVSVDDMDSLLMYFEMSKVKWFDAGMKLGLSQDTLDNIQKLCHSDEKCFTALLKQLIRYPQPPTMRDVLKVLKLSGVKLGPIVAHATRAIIHDPSKRPPEHTDSLSDEKQKLIVSLQEQTLAIRKEFTELVNVVMEEYQRCQVSPDFLMQLFDVQIRKDRIDSVADVLSVATAEGYLSFYNYDKLKTVSSTSECELHSELLYKQQEYDTHFGEYCKRRLRKFPSDGAAVEEKVVFLMDNKMGLQRSAELELKQLQSQVSKVTGFRVSKLVWIEDDWQEPTLGAELSDKEEGVEEFCSARELDSAPTLPQPREPCPPLQRYLPDSKK